MGTIDLARIREAHARIRPHIHRTPVLTSSRFDAATGASLFFKCENFQKVGSFKARGATNAVFALDDQTAKHGVAGHSSGNHGQALAWAAGLRRIPAHVVMPSNSSKVKIDAVEGYGARITLCEPNDAAREAACADILAKTGATLVHPFETEDVMAGQGTSALELLEEVGDLDIVLCPVGGGGLLAGTGVVAKSLRPGIRVIAAEPENVDDAAQSFRVKKRLVTEKKFTIADGLRANVGTRNFEIIQDRVDDIVTASEEAIVEAMRAIWQTMKILVEPSAAVPFAAILERKVDLTGRRVGIILTGGNIDLNALPWK